MHPLIIELLSFCLGVLTDEFTRKSHKSGEYKMSIQKFTFGQSNAAATTAKADKPKAQFWLNIGYVANEALMMRNSSLCLLVFHWILRNHCLLIAAMLTSVLCVVHRMTCWNS
ncbi:hypothetical protein psb1_0040 [Shigella phage pSb-1]|uniref:Uncharacterized protein n=1 Tax=Shigella phage pSb-1 TaxID=1414738 RepID=V5UQH8_9CAUD|nr:hypothetical protein psb1_0040 [Shigella phage pSb-1]AHB79458.1 hypothetical protein psb1_0040 [Shigella phage pSb-1]